MAEKKIGTVVYRRALSPLLEIFRLMPEQGSIFPVYKAGQYLALSRDNCKLTKKIVGDNGQMKYVYDVDESNTIKRGTVTHSYSISSAPSETRRSGYLEFYVVLEIIKMETPGRLSESLFSVDPEMDNKVYYVNKITGEFTLDRRASGFQNVVMVGTGTGLAPFASMIKEAYHEALDGKPLSHRYMLFHANRTFKELGYHEELKEIEKSGKIDFIYVPSVSRPIQNDRENSTIGIGRANNILRTVFGMPLKEEELFKFAQTEGGDVVRAENNLKRTVVPILPAHVTTNLLLDRMQPSSTVILTCGNPQVMEDIQFIAESNNIRFEKEEW